MRPRTVEASSHIAAFANRNSTGAFTERSIAARRRLSLIWELDSLVSMVWSEEKTYCGAEGGLLPPVVPGDGDPGAEAAGAAGGVGGAGGGAFGAPGGVTGGAGCGV